MRPSFPVANGNTKLVDNDGTLSAEGVNIFNVLKILWDQKLAESGIRPPALSATDQTSIEQNGSKIISGIGHRPDINEYVALKTFGTGFRYEKILTQPLP